MRVAIIKIYMQVDNSFEIKMVIDGWGADVLEYFINLRF